MKYFIAIATLNTKKRKAKKRDCHYIDGWRKQNKFYKQKGLEMMTLTEYIDYVHGVYKKRKAKNGASSTNTGIRNDDTY